MISNLIVPFGTITSATSPTFLPKRPFPIGELTEESSPKNTTLYFSLLTETKDLIKANMAMLELYNEQYDSNIEPPTMNE